MRNVDLTHSHRVRPWLWCFAFAALLPVAAYADDYADVSRLVSARQYKEALTKANQFLSSKPSDPQMRFLQGVALSESGRVAEAIPVFIKITEDFPDLPEPHNNLAVLYTAQNQLDKARASLEAAIRNNPSYATAQENLGDVYARLASQAYSRALRLDANNAGIKPKLATIRTLFNPTPKTQQASVAAPVVSVATEQYANTAVWTPPTQVVAASGSLSAAQAPQAAVKATAAGSVDSSMQASPSTDVQGSIDATVRNWAAAWSQKDVTAYLAAYAKDFAVPGMRGRQSWEDERRRRILGKSQITVQLNDVVVTTSDGKATVKFRQSYSADKLQQTSRKTLELVLVGGRWLITRETEGS